MKLNLALPLEPLASIFPYAARLTGRTFAERKATMVRRMSDGRQCYERLDSLFDCRFVRFA